MQMWPELVEAKLISVEHDIHQQTVRFGIDSRLFGKKTLYARTVKKFLVNEFIEQNIIDAIYLYGQEDVSDEQFDDLAFMLFRTTFGALNDPQRVKVLLCFDELKNGSKFLLKVDAIYGAYVYLLASEIVLLEDEADPSESD